MTSPTTRMQNNWLWRVEWGPKGHRCVRLGNQCPVHSAALPRGLYFWAKSHPLKIPGHGLFSKDMGLVTGVIRTFPVHMFGLFRKDTSGASFSLNGAWFVKWTHFWTKKKEPFLLDAIIPRWLENRLEFGPHSSLAGHLVPFRICIARPGSSGGLAMSQSRENRGSPPLGFLSYQHCKRSPCTGKVGKALGGWLKKKRRRRTYLENGSPEKNYFSRKV